MDRKVKRLIQNNDTSSRLKILTKTASNNYIENFDNFILNSGDVISFDCRLVNNKPWFCISQEGPYCISSYYDGPDYEVAKQMYKDLLTAFKGISNTERFLKFEPKINRSIDLLINEKKNDNYNFQRLKSNPLFLGVNRDDF